MSIIGLYYGIIHTIYMLIIGFILLFNNNITYLSILLVIIILNIFVNLVFHNCPLTCLEEKYLKNSHNSNKLKKMKQMNIMYNCNHCYENQLDILINVYIMFLSKIIFLLFGVIRSH